MAIQTPTGRSLKSDRDYCFMLGLAISAATMLPGQRRTTEEIAHFVTAAGAPTSKQRIEQIEKQAMRKLRHPSRIAFFKDEL